MTKVILPESLHVVHKLSQSTIDHGQSGGGGASWPWVRSKAIDLASLTRVARDAKRFMALGAIEGNRPRQFHSGGTGCQALHGLGCDRRQSTSPVSLGWRGIFELAGLTWVGQDAKCCMAWTSI